MDGQVSFTEGITIKVFKGIDTPLPYGHSGARRAHAVCVNNAMRGIRR